MIDVSLQLDRGQFSLEADFATHATGITGLVGPSGSGKSTLCACLAGHLRAATGWIRLRGRTLFDSSAGLSVPAAARRIGLVFQDGALFPHLSVRRNLVYGGGREDLLTEIVHILDLDPLLDARPRHLSGGERQRVALGRALMAEPDLLLLDEPVSALDPGMRARTLDLIERIQDRTATPMIYISHSRQEVQRLCSRVILLENGRVGSIATLDRSIPHLHLAGAEAYRWAV